MIEVVPSRRAEGAIRGATEAVGDGRLLDGLTPMQRAAVTIDAAPLCILAGAGAGKTRVLTRRVAHRISTGSAAAGHVLVITFTRKAAGEISERLSGLGLRDQAHTGTFHAVAAAQLRRWWADRGLTAPALLERKSRLLAPLAAARPDLAGIAPAQLAGHIEWAKSRLLGPDELEAALAGRGDAVPAAAIAGLYRRYEDEKRRRGLIDFDDLLGRCADAFHTDASFASAQRWRWRHVFVDEFQDVNPLQHRLLEAWLGASTDLCVVGDANQAIYSWNGADPRLLERVADRWPSTTVVRLDDNHRCSPQIVATAAAVLGEAGAGLRSSRPDGPAPVFRSYPSDDAEAHGVAGALRAAHRRGRPWSDMAVLVRTNAQVGALAEAFEMASVPYRAPGRTALVDDPAVAGLVGGWRRAPGRPVQSAIAELTEVLASKPAAGEEAGSVAALVDLARSFERSEGPATVGALLAWAATAGAERPGAPDSVTICTFHRAKGLEWGSVWVCGLESGLVPLGRADTEAATAEERRLLYVALTRAGTDLACSWAQTRRFGSKPVPRSPSPWLPSLAGTAPGAPGDETGPPPEVLGAQEWRGRLDEQRRLLDEQRGRLEHHRRSPGPQPQPVPRLRRAGQDAVLEHPDDAVLEALEGWRASIARASGVPAHVVLHDRTLAALASLRPATTDELLAVPGVGPVKAARLGPTLLDIVAHRRASA